ncbi:MAG TPA: hypothetical protein ENI23_09680 [bacterium]|nr:hypothetical protein [bacterium]
MGLKVHQRTGVQGQVVPILEDTLVDIPKHLFEKVARVQELATELNSARYELGRLAQVQHHLIFVCNNTENNLKDVKNEIIKTMKLPDGNWAIDTEARQVGRVSSVPPKAPLVA